MQDVWSKGWYEDEEVLEERKNAGTDEPDPEELERRRTEGLEETSSAEIETRKMAGLNEASPELINKSVELPEELVGSKLIPEDIKSMISKTIDEITSIYSIDMSDIEFAPYYENPKAPFTFIPYEVDGLFHAKLNVNKLFDWNESLEAFDDRVYNKNYKTGILAARSAEDLIYHEAAHFITFKECKTYSEYIAKEAEVRGRYIEGVSQYADASMDGAETIAEAFVRRKNGEDLAEDVSSLLKEYIKV